MAEPLDAQVVLDIADAEARVEDLRQQLEQALSGAADTFGSSMSEMLDSVSAAATDTFTALSSEGSTGLTQVGTDAESAASELGAMGTEGAGALGEVATAAGEAGGAVSDIGASSSGLAQVADEAGGATESLLSMGDEGAASLDELSQAASDAGGAVAEIQSASAEADSSVGDLSSATAGLATGLALAKGEGSNVAKGMQALGVTSSVATKGILGVAVAMTAFFTAGVRAKSAHQQLVIVFGEEADALKEIDIGGLTGNLNELAESVGTTGAQLDNSLARLGAYAQVSGFTADQTKTFTQQVAALGLRAVALNPSIGSVDQAIKSLSRGLAVGGRFAQNYYLNLSRPEITARAIQMFGGTASALTQTQRAAAGASLAVERLGGKLGKDFADGASTADNQLKALKAAVENTFEEAGTGLVDSLLSLLRAMVPVATTATSLLGPALAAVADILEFLGPLIPPVVTAFLAFKAVGAISTILNTMAAGLVATGAALPVVGAGAVVAAGGMKALSTALKSSGIGLIISVAVAAAQAFGLFGDSAEEAGTDINELAKASNKSFREIAAAYAELRKGIAQGGVAEEIANESTRGALRDFRDLAIQDVYAASRFGSALLEAGVISGGQFQRGIRAGLAAQKDAAKAMEENQAAADKLTESQRNTQFHTDILTASTKAQDSVYKATVSSYVALTEAGFEHGKALRAEAEEYAVAEQAASQYKTAQDILNTSTLTLTQAELSQVGSIRQLSAELLFSKGNIDINTAAGLSNLNQIVSTTQAVQGHSQALVAAGFGHKVANENLQKYTEGLIFQLLVAGNSTTAVGALITKLGLTGSVVDPATRSLLGFGEQVGVELPKKSKKGGDDYKTEITRGLVTGTRDAIKAATRIFSGDTELVASARAKGLHVGSAFGQAIANGIDSQRGVVKAAARAIVRAAVDAAENAGSPSEHLFFDLGEGLMGALAEGLTASSGAVLAASTDAVRTAAAVPLPSAPTGGFGAGGGVGIGGVASVDSSALSAAARAIQDAADRLSSSGGDTFVGVDPNDLARQMDNARRWDRFTTVGARD